MKTIYIVLIVLAVIQSFLHCTRGKIHDFEKIFGGLYSILFVILTIYSIVKYGWINLLIVPAIFYISNLVFTIIFEKLLKY
ncbi:MAG: hypothetical protein IJI49_03780 [Bacilli bacterium]|nr:hypothetical protein [Bacilli bacterium]